MEDSKFEFDPYDNVSITVEGIIYAIKSDYIKNKMSFKKYEKSADSEAMQVSELPPPQQFRKYFALCLIRSRYIMLSGGTDQ